MTEVKKLDDKRYIICSLNEKVFLKRDNMQKLTSTTSSASALLFEKTKAENVIKNCMSATEAVKWKIICIDEFNDSDKSDKTVIKVDTNNPYYKQAVEIEELYTQLSDEKDGLMGQQSELDKRLSDIYHFIGTNNPPAHIRAKVYGIQQEIVVKRSEVKERLRYVEALLLGFTDKVSDKKIRKEIVNAQNQDYKGRTDTYDELMGLIVGKKLA